MAYRRFWALLNCSWPQSIILAKARSLLQWGLSMSAQVPSANCLILLNSQTQTNSTAQTCSGRNPMRKKIRPRQLSPHCNFCWLEELIYCHYRIPHELQKEPQLWQFAIFFSKGQGHVMLAAKFLSLQDMDLNPLLKIRNWCAEHVGFVGTHRCCC